MNRKELWGTLSKSPIYIQELFWEIWDLWKEKIDEFEQVNILRHEGEEFKHVLDEKLIEILEKKILNLQKYDERILNLDFIEKTFPIPYLLISPRKHAIILYSIYRRAIGGKNNSLKMANYGEFISYMFRSENPPNYYLEKFYMFFYNYLKLIKLLTPIRRIIGLETGKKHYKNVALISDKLVTKLIPILSTPSNFTISITKILELKGFGISLAFVYKVARISYFIGKKIIKSDLRTESCQLIETKLCNLFNWFSEQLIREKKNKSKLTILSIAHMSDKNICIAGIFEKGKWGRLIYNNEKLPLEILKEKNIYFSNFDVINLSILTRKINPPFIEDYLINWSKKPETIRNIPTRNREEFLSDNCENSTILKYIKKEEINKIGEILEKINRSLILIGPISIDFALFKRGVIKKFQGRIKYSLFNSSFKSEDSISCTDKLWRKLGQIILNRYNLPRIRFNEKDLKEIFGISKTFVVIGLSRKYKGRFWELIVGLHTVPDIELIINRLNQGEFIDKMAKFLKNHKNDFLTYTNYIPFNLNQRTFPNLIKKKISKILKNFDESPTNSLFQLFNLYESELREYIKIEISKETPSQWYKKHIEPIFDATKIGRIDSKFHKDNAHTLEHIYNHPNPLIYTNLEDLHKILSSEETHKKYFSKLTEIDFHYMRKVEEYRNAVLHYRPITNKEDVIFYVIKILETTNNSENNKSASDGFRKRI